MLYGSETLPLLLKDETNNTRIHFYVEHYSLIYEQDYENNVQIEQRTNQVECYYFFNDDDGWGTQRLPIHRKDMYTKQEYRAQMS